MLPTLDHAPSCFGVTLLQCAPASSVRQTRPSSVPVHSSFACNGEEPIEYTAARALVQVVGDGRRIEIGRHRRIGTRQVGTDRSPVFAAVGGLPQPLVAE